MKLNKLLIAGLSSILLIGTSTAKEDEKKKGPKKPRPAKKTFAELDTDKDGKLSEAEYTAPAKGKGAEKAKERFAKKDKDKDGFLSEEEFKKGKPARKDPKKPKKGPKKKKK